MTDELDTNAVLAYHFLLSAFCWHNSNRHDRSNRNSLQLWRIRYLCRRTLCPMPPKTPG